MKQKPVRRGLSVEEKRLWETITKDIVRLPQKGGGSVQKGRAPASGRDERPSSLDHKSVSSYTLRSRTMADLLSGRTTGRSAAGRSTVDRSTADKSTADRGIPKKDTFLTSQINSSAQKQKTPYDSRVHKAQSSGRPARAGITRSEDVFMGGDPAFDRQVRRGRIAIDARLDLHGLTQVEAHTQLQRFVLHARTRQFRCVLVITGKGAALKPGDKKIKTAIMAFDQQKPRGIIRTRFMEWVNDPPLRDCIIRVAGAHPRDGGGGAFYIFLRR